MQVDFVAKPQWIQRCIADEKLRDPRPAERHIISVSVKQTEAYRIVCMSKGMRMWYHTITCASAASHLYHIFWVPSNAGWKLSIPITQSIQISCQEAKEFWTKCTICRAAFGIGWAHPGKSLGRWSSREMETIHVQATSRSDSIPWFWDLYGRHSGLEENQGDRERVDWKIDGVSFRGKDSSPWRSSK